MMMPWLSNLWVSEYQMRMLLKRHRSCLWSVTCSKCKSMQTGRVFLRYPWEAVFEMSFIVKIHDLSRQSCELYGFRKLHSWTWDAMCCRTCVVGETRTRKSPREFPRWLCIWHQRCGGSSLSRLCNGEFRIPSTVQVAALLFAIMPWSFLIIIIKIL